MYLLINNIIYTHSSEQIATTHEPDNMFAARDAWVAVASWTKPSQLAYEPREIFRPSR